MSAEIQSREETITKAYAEPIWNYNIKMVLPEIVCDGVDSIRLVQISAEWCILRRQ
jgi:hypothetical protein